MFLKSNQIVTVFNMALKIGMKSLTSVTYFQVSENWIWFTQDQFINAKF